MDRSKHQDRRKVIDPTLFMAKRLNLNQEQRATFRHLRIRFRARMDILEQLDRSLHNRFFNLGMLTTADSSQAFLLADSIAIVRREMEILTLGHFTILRQQLDDRQQRKFDTLFYDALKAVLPPPPPPPLPPPPPPLPAAGKETNQK
jgi:hypothetical protein